MLVTAVGLKTINIEEWFYYESPKTVQFMLLNRKAVFNSMSAFKACDSGCKYSKVRQWSLWIIATRNYEPKDTKVVKLRCISIDWIRILWNSLMTSCFWIWKDIVHNNSRLSYGEFHNDVIFFLISEIFDIIMANIIKCMGS